MPTHSNGSGCVPISPPWQPRGLCPPTVHTRDGGTVGAHSRGCGIAPGATTLPPPCRQPPPGCHIPPEAASLLATLTPPLPAVLPALLRCPRPAHVCMHVRAACSPPAFCTGGLHFSPELFAFCTEAGAVAFSTGDVSVLHRWAVASHTRGVSILHWRGRLHFLPGMLAFCTSGVVHFALGVADAFCTRNTCILYLWALHFAPGMLAFCTGSSCILHQGRLLAFCTRDACLLFAPGTLAFCTRDACFLHQGCLLFALVAVASCTRDTLLFAPGTLAFCTGSSCILHQGRLYFAPMGFAFCTRNACILHRRALHFAPGMLCILHWLFAGWTSCLLPNPQAKHVLLLQHPHAATLRSQPG